MPLILVYLIYHFRLVYLIYFYYYCTFFKIN